MPRGKDEPKTLGELGAKPFRGGEENRAKDAKDAKVKGMEDGELGGRYFVVFLAGGGWKRRSLTCPLIILRRDLILKGWGADPLR